jgi:cryptochrome
MSKNSIYWFRKCLRLHDNPALLYALQNSQSVYPIFILDPWFVENAKVGPNRWRFLLESLNDLNNNLIKKNSRLLLIRGKPLEILKEKIKEWNIDLVCFESDTEPYAKQRDSHVANLLTELNVKLVTKCSHTLWDPNVLNAKNSNKPCF